MIDIIVFWSGKIQPMGMAGFYETFAHVEGTKRIEEWKLLPFIGSSL